MALGLDQGGGIVKLSLDRRERGTERTISSIHPSEYNEWKRVEREKKEGKNQPDYYPLNGWRKIPVRSRLLRREWEKGETRADFCCPQGRGRKGKERPPATRIVRRTAPRGKKMKKKRDRNLPNSAFEQKKEKGGGKKKNWRLILRRHIERIM